MTKQRTVKKKKRRGFHGKRPQDKRNDAEVADDVASSHLGESSSQALQNSTVIDKLENVSERKLRNSDFHTMDADAGIMTRNVSKNLGISTQGCVEPINGFKLIDSDLLQKSFLQSAICSSCKNPNSQLNLIQLNEKRLGLAECLTVRCSECHKETIFFTSKKVQGKGRAYDINRRSVLASQGIGRSGLSKLCAKMDLPSPVNKKSYNQHVKHGKQAAVKHADKLMIEAAKRLFNATADCDKGMYEDKLVADVAVTVDGTWQRRGHSSKMGVIFIISVLTGEILDYEVKSLVCHECRAHDKWDHTSDKYTEWKQGHENNCQINHVGSSGNMEVDGAIDIFGRSIDTRSLRYTIFVGDGDSSCYGSVCEAMKEKYGDSYLIIKEECVGHVQKRMGAALMNYVKDKKKQKLSDGKGVSGKGRLTQLKIKKIQNYYGIAIRQNAGDLSAMRKSIWAIKHHMIVNDTESLDVQHTFCPKGKGTWCRFWADKENGTSVYNQNDRLPNVFLEELSPIFKRLSSDDLLKRCLKGLTQNQNESVNGQLWSRCPKTVFCGKRRVVIAVCETITVSNTGAGSKVSLLKAVGISPGRNMLAAARKEDKMRVSVAAGKVQKKVRMQRKTLRMKAKTDTNKVTAYKAGAFGLGKETEIPGKKIKRKRKRCELNDTVAEEENPINNPANTEVAEILYCEPEQEVVALPRKRKKTV